MANLVITDACNLDCAFCFAGEYRAAAAARAMPAARVAALGRAAGAELRLCGGEPTLHPDFAAILTAGLAAHPRVFVMTNGLWPEPVRAHLAGLAPADWPRLTLLVNALPPASYAAGMRERLARTLDAVPAARIALGVTLDAPDYDPSFALALAQAHGIGQLRFSLAAPTITEPHSWRLAPERDYPRLARTIAGLADAAGRAGVRLQSDCAYVPPCFFSAAERELLAAPPHDVGFTCQGPLDLNGEAAWRCFGLYGLWRLPLGGATLAELDRELERRTRSLAALPLRDACAGCAERALCGGGCYAQRVVDAARARARRAGVEIADGASLAAAHLARDVTRLRPFGDHWLALDDGEWSEPELTALERALLAAADGQHTIAELARRLGEGSDRAATFRAVLRLHALGLVVVSAADAGA